MKGNKISLDQIVLTITIISFTWIIFYQIYFITQSEIFNYAYEIGEISYGILSSIVASGIFYYFVVYLDKKRKENIINKIILKKLQSIRVGAVIIKKDVFPLFGLKRDSEIPYFEEFEKFCKGIDLRTIAPSIPNTTLKPITWYEYFEYFFQSDRANSQLLYEHLVYLDLELIELLDEIQYPLFQRALNSYKTNGYTHDISGAPGPFWLYLNSLDKIAKYCTKLERKYQ